jgi:uncharacterized protein DUF5615
VRVLLDEQLPRQLIRELPGHEVGTVQREGWAGIHNGALLTLAAERGFQVFLTKDQSVRFQQNLSKSVLGIVVVVAPRHAIEVLRPMIPDVLDAIGSVRPGEVKLVERRRK